MKKRHSFLILSLFPIFMACFWDKDTIEMERQQFPTILELIVGKFLRHSPEFHYWRIKERTTRLKSYPDSLSLYDDIAVSYSKLGDQEKAIALMMEKDEKKPGLYETYANLGTFYLHHGQFAEGISYIEKAIQVNPDAHFGREKYQLLLAKYVQSKMQNGQISLPLWVINAKNPLDFPSFIKGNEGFYHFLITQEHPEISSDPLKYQLPKQEWQNAVAGLAGMMKFGNYDSPILLEAMGDLLAGFWEESAARNLAARAYLKASYQLKDQKAINAYRKKAVFLLALQQTDKNNSTVIDITDLEKVFQEDIKEGEDFYHEIAENEAKWINEGKNPEQEFSKLYYQEPVVTERKQIGKGYRSDALLFEVVSGSFADLKILFPYREELDSALVATIDASFMQTGDTIATQPDPKATEPQTLTFARYAFLVLPFIIFAYLIWQRLRGKKK